MTPIAAAVATAVTRKEEGSRAAHGRTCADAPTTRAAASAGRTVRAPARGSASVDRRRATAARRASGRRVPTPVRGTPVPLAPAGNPAAICPRGATTCSPTRRAAGPAATRAPSACRASRARAPAPPTRSATRGEGGPVRPVSAFAAQRRARPGSGVYPAFIADNRRGDLGRAGAPHPTFASCRSHRPSLALTDYASIDLMLYLALAIHHP